MESKLSDALVRLWGSNRPSLSTLGSATAEALRRRYQVGLPEEFEAYLVQGAPQADWMDYDGIIWWRPERIQSLRDECPGETPAAQRNPEIEHRQHQYLIFADFLDWCYAYAICCAPGLNWGKVALIGVEPDRFVARSLSSFVLLAAEASNRLHAPAGDYFTDLV